MMNKNLFKQTNAYAMQYGLLLGVWGFLTLVLSVLAQTHVWLGWISTVLFWGSPVAGALLTLRFRAEVNEKPTAAFSFGRGFAFTFLLGLYAGVWIALGVFVYFKWFDHGYFCDLYEQVFATGEARMQMARQGVSETQLREMIEQMRMMSPGVYAGTIFFLSLIADAPISLIIALIAHRSEKIA